MKQSDQFKYTHFVNRIEVDDFEEAIGFDPIDEKDGLDLGHCPDPWGQHKNGDTTGKFAIIREACRYNCWVCGKGSFLDLAMAINDMTEQEAEEWLFQFTRVGEETDEDFLSEIQAILYQEKKTEPAFPYFNERVLEKWTDNMHAIGGWLEDRGISDAIAVKYRIGYDPHLLRLAKKKGDARKEKPYNGPCVIFPHVWNDRLAGWQCRWLDEDRPGWVPKYTNTSDFPKETTIYNYEAVYLSSDPIVVVESVPTCLFLLSMGIPSMAVFGGSVTPEQVRLLRLCQQGLIIAPDNDKPGRKWVERDHDPRAKHFPLAFELAQFVPVKICPFVGEEDSGDDLGDLAQNREEARKLLGKAYFHEALI